MSGACPGVVRAAGAEGVAPPSNAAKLWWRRTPMGQDRSMGAEVDATTFTREDRKRHREKVRKDLDVLARMLQESRFDFERPMTGLEIELNLVDEDTLPAMKNAEVLGAIADPDFVTELGQFNIEINVAPRQLAENGVTAFENQVRASLNAAEMKARTRGAHMVMIGILPTLRGSDLTHD